MTEKEEGHYHQKDAALIADIAVISLKTAMRDAEATQEAEIVPEDIGALIQEAEETTEEKTPIAHLRGLNLTQDLVHAHDQEAFLKAIQDQEVQRERTEKGR